MAPRPHLLPLKPLRAPEPLCLCVREAIGLPDLEGAEERRGRAQRRGCMRGVREGRRHHRGRRLVDVIKVQVQILVVPVIVLALCLGCVVVVMVVIKITGHGHGVCAIGVGVGVVNANSIVIAIADGDVLVREKVAVAGIVGCAAGAI